MKREPLLLKKLNGGWNTEDPSDELQLNESPDMENADFTKGGDVKKADGIVELGSDSEVATITSILKAPNRNGISWLFKFVGTKLKLYDNVSELWFSAKTGITAGEKWGDVVFDNTLYLGNKVDNAMSLDLGKITRLDGAILDGATNIDLVDASQLPSSGDIYINNTLVSYTGKSTNELTGCSNAVATPDNYLATGAFTEHASTPKGNMYIIFGGRLVIAGVLTSGGATIYGSKATDRTNFTIAGGGTANDAFAEALISQIKSIQVFYDDNFEERIMAFLSNNTIHNLAISDDSDLGTLVITNRFFKGNVTALNHFSTVVGPNDIFHVDLDNQIRTLGPRGSGGDSDRNFSDIISDKHKTLFRDEYNFDNAAGAIVNNQYWCICREENSTHNDRIIIYDIVKGVWKKRTGIIAADIIEFDNRITIALAAQNKVLQVIPNELADDKRPMKFKYSIPDLNYTPLNFEAVRLVRIGGIMSSNCIITVKVYRDFGSILLGTFTLRGNNTDIMGSILNNPGAFGQIAFGGAAFGGQESDDRRFFIAQLNLKAMPDLENFRVVIENTQRGVYLEISKIRPDIFTKNLQYFPAKYQLADNN